MKLGFLINPIAGMGGRVGLKGTDGVLEEALHRGATPIAQERALKAMERYYFITKEAGMTNELPTNVIWYTCAGKMGYNILNKINLEDLPNHEVKVVFEPQNIEKTTSNDTKDACQCFIKLGVELIIFCGGDGTARDVYSVVKDSIPIFGIPSGVKMHSGVFATHPGHAGDLLFDYLKGDMDTADGEILDLDEDLYRKGEWNIQLFGIAKTPQEPTLIQRGKHMVETASDAEVKEEIAEYIKEEMENDLDTLFIMGSGSTVQTITQYLGLEGSLLGIDAIFQNKIIGKDLNEKQLLRIMADHPHAKLIVSPIGAQGFILGRGNLQLSPAVIRKIGIKNIIIVSTPAKLMDIEVLKVDTNDKELDLEFAKKGWLTVTIGYRQMKLKKVTN